jgi:hypothetical protein
MATGKSVPGPAGTQTSALAFGANDTTTTEEFTGGPTVVARTVTGT